MNKDLQMADELRQLSSLKQYRINEISPDSMYSTIKEEKFELASLLRDELKIRDSFIASQNSDCENSEQLF